MVTACLGARAFTCDKYVVEFREYVTILIFKRAIIYKVHFKNNIYNNFDFETADAGISFAQPMKSGESNKQRV